MYADGVSRIGEIRMRNVQTDRQHLTGQVVRLLLAGCLALPGIAAAADDSKVFVGARIIDGTGKAAVEQATLLVRNGRIEAVGRLVEEASRTPQIDASGKAIIP